MAHIFLVSCVGAKLSTSAPAQDLYVSPWFIKARAFAEKHCDSWYVLSAEYGLVDPLDVIKPYENTLNNQTIHQRREWGANVWTDLQQKIINKDKITVLAGKKYRDHLVPEIEAFGCCVSVPMHGLGIGQQLQWLDQKNQQPTRNKDINRFYDALRRLEQGVDGKRLLGECTGRGKWPQKGLYFFFESGEFRSKSKEERIVRIGTHGVSLGSKTTLWDRLRTHRGSTQGTGNHRGSIFRLHVGKALAARTPSIEIPTWGKGSSASTDIRELERPLEQLVSEYIGSMKLLWLAVEDKSSSFSDRAYLERNLIGLLTYTAKITDLPSKDWLGQFSVKEKIRQSALWNLDCMDVPVDWTDITSK